MGNLDGIPAEARDAANRTILPREIARVQGEIDAVQTQLASMEGPGERIQTTQAQARLDLLNEKMDALRATESAIGPAGGGRQLLLLDVKPDRPKAAIATGNVDTAEHVAVFTPGMNTTVAGDLQRYIGDMEAQQLAADREARRLGNNDLSIATVTWIGYEPPSTDDFGSVSHFPGRSEQAQRGGQDLAGFLDGINTSRDTDPHLSAIGHSYGSTTTGYAMQGAGGVDEAVFYGSPGLSVNDSADLNVPAGHATVIEARNDPIADLAAFGADPNHVDGVTNLSAKQERLPDGRVLDESIGHSAYLTRGTTSQHNIAVTIGGMPEQRVEGRPTGIGDALNGLVPN
ncbi:MAG: alpha/beta hydrolase [Pseudonocardiaceae bacterium]